MTNTTISRAIAGTAVFGFAMALFLAIPQAANATTYSNNYPNYYGSGYQSPIYPPAPTYLNTPTVQVTYSNGYYTNYFVPTVRYYPPVYTIPVPTVYNPIHPVVFNNPVVIQNGGYYGGYRHW